MFQTRLRELRELTGYKSQQAVAEAFGVAQSTVGGWESGKREPNYETTLRLSNFFGVPVGCLLDDKMEDKYSAQFRNGIFRIMSKRIPPNAGDGDEYYDYEELVAIVEGTFPFSLAEACRIAEKVGVSVSDLLMEGPGDSEEKEKSPGADKSGPRDVQEEILIEFVHRMDPAQKSLLIEILNKVDLQNPKEPASDRVVVGEISPISERRD